MPRSRLIFFVIIGAAVVVVIAAGVISPALQSANVSQSSTATAQYVKDNIVTIRVSYGTEKELWFADAVKRFADANPNIRIDRVGEGSMESYEGLSQITDTSTSVSVTGSGNEPIPAVWSPASTIQVNLLNAASQKSLNRDLAVSCKRLVLSPLVIMVWSDRAKVFENYYKDKGGITLANLYDALDPNGKVKGKWEALGGSGNWGLIKIGHTDPMRSNSGVMGLVALANNFYQTTSALKVAQITDDKFQNYLNVLEQAVTRPLINSTGNFANDVIVKGPASYDFVIVYEALAIENYQNAVGKQGQSLRIIYPEYNLYSDHPLCLIDHPSITAAQKDVAKKFQDFLLTTDIQRLALQYGFRPADPSVPIFGGGQTDSFDSPDLKSAGVSNDVGQEIQIPDGNAISNLLRVWRQNSGS